MRAAIAMLPLLVALAGCGGGGAAELLETARLEEIQNNPTHAKQLYQQIVDQYPGTPQAETAAARLRELP
jgi:TolA-binding protein